MVRYIRGSDGAHIRYNNFAIREISDLAEAFQEGDISAQELFNSLDNLQNLLRDGSLSNNPNTVIFFLNNDDAFMQAMFDTDPNTNSINDYYENRLDSLNGRIDLSQSSSVQSLDGNIGARIVYSDGSFTNCKSSTPNGQIDLVA